MPRNITASGERTQFNDFIAIAFIAANDIPLCHHPVVFKPVHCKATVFSSCYQLQLARFDLSFVKIPCSLVDLIFQTRGNLLVEEEITVICSKILGGEIQLSIAFLSLSILTYLISCNRIPICCEIP